MDLHVKTFPGAFPALLVIALLTACSGKEPEKPPVPVAEVAVQVVKTQLVPVTFDFVGQTESSQQVEIRARVNGFLEKRLYNEGAFVKPGQVMFLIDPKPFDADLQAARAELAQQKARLSTARANLQRVKPLVADNALAVKDLDDATGNEQAATAAVEAAGAKVTNATLNLSYATITSPVAGLSSFAKVQNGAYVSGQNSVLTYVAKLDPMRVNFSLSENESLRRKDEIAKGLLTKAPNDDYTVELLLADGSTFPARGRITFADAAFSQETGTFLLRAEIPNPEGDLRPGQFVRVRVYGFKRPNAIVVPQRAVQQGPRGAFVWVVSPEGKAVPQPVEAGDWLGDQWLVSSGLKDGAQVVVDGFMRLAPGAPVKTKEVAAPPLPVAALQPPSVPTPTAKGAGASGGGASGGGTGASGTSSAGASGPASGATGSGAASGASGSGATSGASGSGTTSGASASPPSPAASPGTGTQAAASDADAVFFDQGRSAIDATGRARLQAVAASLKAQPGARVAVHGFVDASGNAKANAKLAKERAQAVRDALIAAGIPRERIAMEKPTDIVGGKSPAHARRVDVVVVGAR
ncbi:efflux RND transporter periplasmic adaptor subunit [Variovorax rhizosphaerae]|uniref:Efflux RND transporter periplasmic adaptor subunit n=1 Tax=Variovorax rhizosphaerae TaxID=1836200 RepID=A0ABU8WTN9_9BURK